MNQNYLVLARKYRPLDFSGLKGQDFLVTTIVNAIKLNRLAHTFLLTGIRGGGKTTTARIIARTINCSEPIFEEKLVLPCKKCQNCLASLNDKHPDIIELDAASRTGVDDVRSIIENASYLPLLGKYKVYIIDEVHMLSTSAFNALLKTLEEPPAHVKFIFATTELRKIPVTILSRCQKFELRRQTSEEIAQNLNDILKKENIEAEDSAISLVANHSEGSVRDSLSILDMVIANANNEKITKEQVKGLLGLTDSNKIIELLNYIISGDVAAAIKLIDEVYYLGKDLLCFFQNLLEVIHIVSKLKHNLKCELDEYNDSEIITLTQLATDISIASLTILWQMILKAIQEMQYSSNQKLAAEMLMIRLCYLSNIPTTAELVNQLDSDETRYVKAEIESLPEKKNFSSYEELVALFLKKKEMLLYEYLVNDVQLVLFDPPMLKLVLSKNIPANFTNKVASMLQEYTGEKWIITASTESSNNVQDTLAMKIAKEKNQQIEEICKTEIVAEVIKLFPEAKIAHIHSHEEIS